MRKSRIVGGGVGAAILLAWGALVYGVPCCGGCCLLWGWLPVCGSLCGASRAVLMVVK